jgi:Ni,Fe-hydrogenase III component G
MGRGEMEEVAEIIHEAMQGENQRRTVVKIKALRKGFQKVKYTFESSPAYFFR